MELRILSLNVRLWTKENNPFKPHFWLWRTFKQARMFRRENPDIICLQEVERPVGRFLLGLEGYVGYGTNTRIPIYVKKSKILIAETEEISGGRKDTNGHGIVIICVKTPLTELRIQNCHYSWERDKRTEEMSVGYLPHTIFCGDMNVDRYTFTRDVIKHNTEQNIVYLYPKKPEGYTYVSYEEPLKYMGDIDQFGYIGPNPPKAKVTVLPDRVSDHFAIKCKIEL